MDLAADILAAMALNPLQEPTCHFMRLPLELRKGIYALLLLSPPVPRVHCTIGTHSKQCSPGGRFLASTCKPRATVTRTICCGTCEWRGGDVHMAILSANKAIYEEASDVLYENSQLVCYPNGLLDHSYPACANDKIRRYVFVLSVDPAAICRVNWYEFAVLYPSLKVVELHFDVDLSKPEPHYINAQGFDHLTEFNEVVVVVDVHIICAWDDIDGTGWFEPISRRGDISETRARALDKQACEMREGFIKDLEVVFKAADKTLVIGEN